MKLKKANTRLGNMVNTSVLLFYVAVLIFCFIYQFREIFTLKTDEIRNFCAVQELLVVIMFMYKCLYINAI